ncbi:MarR family winged helix-turn-helix transcriptional regulator [Ponticaulis koreensis]|uniref:MarR family winged helix-turn-helix transcriptional regulator n=1 Tax=Ponticaulis koreensis TaxID=1123045 RepID=UPI0003B3A210|nr:MarR family transcriptional regulator [Ponticaulis koreensis]
MFFLKYLPTQSLLMNYREHFPAGSEPQISSQLEMLRKASLLLRDLDDFFREHDLSLTRFLILVILDGAHEGLQHSQIVDRIDVSSPVVSRSLGALVSDGLVEVITDAENKRHKLNRLSDEGRARLQALMSGYYEILLRE